MGLASLPGLTTPLQRCETGISGLPADVSPALEKPGEGFFWKDSFSLIESGIVGEGRSVTHHGAGFMKRKDWKTDDKSHSCLAIS